MGRRTNARARADARTAAAHLDRSETWNGLRQGDPVRVAGIKQREAVWEFRAHVVNRRNGTESVEVIGGRPGDRRIRSFGPERIYPVTGRRTRGAAGVAAGGELSLAEAPRLPFG